MLHALNIAKLRGREEEIASIAYCINECAQVLGSGSVKINDNKEILDIVRQYVNMNDERLILKELLLKENKAKAENGDRVKNDNMPRVIGFAPRFDN